LARSSKESAATRDSKPGARSGTEHIESIEKLLNAAHELMKQEPALAGEALEDIRRLKVRVRFAKSSAEKRNPNDLPLVAPALFENRPDAGQGPLAFTVEHYQRWLHGHITRADIRRLNLKLYDAYRNWGVSSEQLDAIGLPTKHASIDQKLLKAGRLKRPRQTVRWSEMDPAERDRARLWEASRRRRRLPLKNTE
jgi:hypothetical protein